MPEKTKTGKWIYPIIDANNMKKDGWFIKKTNTEGVYVRLAHLKSDDTVVVQAYVFDTKNGWNKVKIEKWLNTKKITWIAALDENFDLENNIKCFQTVIVSDNKHKNERFKNMEDENTTIKTTVPVVGPKEISIDTDNGLPVEIVKKNKRIVTHRSKKKGSKGMPLNLNGKDYGRKDGTSVIKSEVTEVTEVTEDLNKCSTVSDKDKRIVRTPNKK